MQRDNAGLVVLSRRLPVVAGPSAHLSWDELACHDGTPYPGKWREDRAVVLGQVFEAVREATGSRPLAVLSGYRTPGYNRAIRGASKSQHVQGRALDLRPPDGMDAREFGAIVRAVAEMMPEGGGVGQYRTFVHVDTRPRNHGHLTTWDG